MGIALGYAFLLAIAGGMIAIAVVDGPDEAELVMTRSPSLLAG